MPKLNRYYIHDRAKDQSTDFNPYFNERYSIIDRESGKTVDEATTRYEARQAASALNAEEPTRHE